VSYPDSSLPIQNLPLIESCADIHLSVGEVAWLFESHPDWPGVILTTHGQYVGMLTRRACSEFLGTFLATRFFSKVPIINFYEKFPASGLVLDGSTSIAVAVKAALKRDGASIYDPIIVRLNKCHYSLLDMWVLLQA